MEITQLGVSKLAIIYYKSIMPFFLFLLTYFIQRRRRLFKTTLTLENAIRALAQEGVICQLIPKTYNSPAAKGIQTRL